jgi:4-aminobutyrate aminotransferase-like enzyme
MAVLDVIADENLIEHARNVGEYTRTAFKRLAEKHSIIGDVRGSGLFMGTEFVLDRQMKEPAAAEATQIINAMRERGVLMGKIGIHQCATKIRPPMPFTRDNADFMLSIFDDVLAGL